MDERPEDTGEVGAGGTASAPGRDGPPAADEGRAAGSRPAPADRLDGTGWTLVRYLADGALVDVPAGVHADARFADGRISGSGGCNAYSARYEAGVVGAREPAARADGATGDAGDVGPGGAPTDRATGTVTRALRIGPTATTMMACPAPQADVERGFLAAIAGTSTCTTDGARLALLGADGSVLAELAAIPADAYLGAWAATGLNNGRQAVVGLATGPAPTLTLGPDGRVTGNATCNRFMGTYAVDGEAMTFAPLATTRMACPTDALAEQEQSCLAALAATATWSVRAGRLELRDASGALQAAFRRA